MRFLLTALACLMSVTVFGQCEIDYDFGDGGFGVSPDASIGETFMNGEVGVDYYDVIHILVPEFASDLDPVYPPTLPFDSLYIDYVTVQDTITNEEIPLADLGFEVVCNNHDDSGLECSFLGGEQYCASLQGVPTMAGVYQINLNVVGWLTIGVPFSVPFTLSQFIVNIYPECTEDLDFDGICDDTDDCFGVYDDCGVCGGDNASCSGCTDPAACNYNPFIVIDDGSCFYGNSGDLEDLFISEYIEGTGQNKAIEIFNPFPIPIDLSNYVIERYSNGSNTVSDALALEGIIDPISCWVVVNGQITDDGFGAVEPGLLQYANQLGNLYPDPMYYNGNDALVLKNYGQIIDIFGKIGEDPGTAWTDNADAGYTDYDGGNLLTHNQTLRRKPQIINGVINNPSVFNTLLEWDTLGVNNWSNLGQHSIIIESGNGCEDYEACNYLNNNCSDCIYPEMYYNCNGQCLIDDDNDGICNELEIAGCTDSTADNYDSSATDDDGSCLLFTPACNSIGDIGWEYLETNIYPLVSSGVFGEYFDIGLALNVNETIIDPMDNQLTISSLSITDVQGLPNGVSSDFSIGQLYPISQECITMSGTPFETGVFALTFNGIASIAVFGTIIDVEISFTHTLEIGENPNPILGCTYNNATNYNIYATDDDGSCEFYGCMDEMAVNYNQYVTTDDGSCEYEETVSNDCIADLDGNGQVGSPDLLLFLGAYGDVCE